MITRYNYLERGKTKLRGGDKVPVQYLVAQLYHNQHEEVANMQLYSKPVLQQERPMNI